MFVMVTYGHDLEHFFSGDESVAVGVVETERPVEFGFEVAFGGDAQSREKLSE